MLFRTAAGRAATALLELSVALISPYATIDGRPSDARPEVPATAPSDAPVEDPIWVPPGWIGDGGAISPWAIDVLSSAPVHRRGPEVHSYAAVIADLDRGEVLWARNADEPLPVASLTKLVSALTLAAQDPDLEQTLCVGPEQYPPRPGARSRFETGACHVGWDWVGAALVASDNRAAMGLPALADLRYEEFLERMGEVSAELGMERATWADPSGIEEGNRATARDIARAAVAVAAHPGLSQVASAPTWRIERERGAQTLNTTNRLVERWETLAAKTGYTDASLYCFADVVRSGSGSAYVVVVLGGPSSGARFGDIERMVRWADSLP